jgi:hypothetical protein
MSSSLKPTHSTNEPRSSLTVQPDPSDQVVVIGERAIPSRPLTVSQPTSSPIAQPYPNGQVVIIGERAIPSRPLTVSELIPLIPAEPQWIFTALVLKWQQDGEYMKTAISLLQNPVRGQSLLAFSPTKSGHSFTANIFKAIRKNVSLCEQFQLIKALLEADQLHGTEIPPTSPGWMKKWRSACNNDQWKDAKRQLVSENLISHEVGEIVLNCAMAVIAERLLRSYMEKLEKFRAQFLCLGISDSGDAEIWRRCYVEILKDTRQRGLDLSLSLYKYSVLVLLWNEETAGFNYAEQRMALESLSLKQHKYVRLINKYIGINLHEVDDVVDNALPLETGK